MPQSVYIGRKKKQWDVEIPVSGDMQEKHAQYC